MSTANTKRFPTLEWPMSPVRCSCNRISFHRFFEFAWKVPVGVVLTSDMFLCLCSGCAVSTQPLESKIRAESIRLTKGVGFIAVTFPHVWEIACGWTVKRFALRNLIPPPTSLPRVPHTSSFACTSSFALSPAQIPPDHSPPHTNENVVAQKRNKKRLTRGDTTSLSLKNLTSTKCHGSALHHRGFLIEEVCIEPLQVEVCSSSLTPISSTAAHASTVPAILEVGSLYTFLTPRLAYTQPKMHTQVARNPQQLVKKLFK